MPRWLCCVASTLLLTKLTHQPCPHLASGDAPRLSWSVTYIACPLRTARCNLLPSAPALSSAEIRSVSPLSVADSNISLSQVARCSWLALSNMSFNSRASNPCRKACWWSLSGSMFTTKRAIVTGRDHKCGVRCRTFAVVCVFRSETVRGTAVRIDGGIQQLEQKI